MVQIWSSDLGKRVALLLVLVTVSVKGSYEYDSSYAYMRLKNPVVGFDKTYCINYQQWQNTPIPSNVDTGLSLNISWYANKWVYEACGDVTPYPLAGSVVPAEYRLQTNESRKCRRFPGKTGWEKEFPYQVSNIENNGGAAALFLMKRGDRYLDGFRDFLFSDFRNVFVNDSTSVPIFYWYRQLWDDVFAAGGGTGDDVANFTATFYRPSTSPIEWAMVIIFCISEFCIVVGGVASGRRRFNLLVLKWCDEVARNQRQNAKIQKLERKLAEAERRRDQAAAANGHFNNADGAPGSSSQGTGSTTTYGGTSNADADGVSEFANQVNVPINGHADDDRGAEGDDPAVSSRKQSQEHETHATPFTWVSLIVMVVFVVGLLLLAYYFRWVMVWLFIVVFMLGGASALYTCLSALVAPCPCAQCRVCVAPRDVGQSLFRRELCPSWRWCSATPTWMAVLIAAVSVAIPIVWCIYRQATLVMFSFLLQDLISGCFCIHFMKGLRMPSLKSTTTLLVCMLVYDLVMVFVTPLLTSNGCSVMVEVATGSGCAAPSPYSQPVPPIDATSPESIPILFKVPRLSDPMLPCYDMDVELQYKPMILGMGDVMLPGLLVSYCFGADYLLNVPYFFYGTVASIAYGLGLIATFFALSVMQMAQPALIYLVPFCLIFTFVAALARREFWVMWTGELVNAEALEASTPINSARNEPDADADASEEP